MCLEEAVDGAHVPPVGCSTRRDRAEGAGNHPASIDCMGLDVSAEVAAALSRGIAHESIQEKLGIEDVHAQVD